jgi:hypothetical protein
MNPSKEQMSFFDEEESLPDREEFMREIEQGSIHSRKTSNPNDVHNEIGRRDADPEDVAKIRKLLNKHKKHGPNSKR